MAHLRLSSRPVARCPAGSICPYHGTIVGQPAHRGPMTKWPSMARAIASFTYPRSSQPVQGGATGLRFGLGQGVRAGLEPPGEEGWSARGLASRLNGTPYWALGARPSTRVRRVTDACGCAQRGEATGDGAPSGEVDDPGGEDAPPRTARAAIFRECAGKSEPVRSFTYPRSLGILEIRHAPVGFLLAR